MTTENSLELALRQLLAAKIERDRLKKQRHSFVMSCEREGDQQPAPCWKAKWEPADSETVNGYWDHAGGNADDGNHAVLWCASCQAREPIQKAYRVAMHVYSHAMTAFWNALHGHARRNAWAGAPPSIVSERVKAASLTTRSAGHA